MAGSLNHLIDRDGKFRISLIENLGDAQEALEECMAIIRDLSGNRSEVVSRSCRFLGLVDPWEVEEDGYRKRRWESS